MDLKNKQMQIIIEKCLSLDDTCLIVKQSLRCTFLTSEAYYYGIDF